MTPYELNLHAEVHEEKTFNDLEEKITMVWLGEYYHRLKRLPSLKAEIKNLYKDSKPVMTDKEMYEMVKLLNKRFDGKVETKSGE
jgi:hypothetical protein